jgi:hypothetical protein
MPSDARYEHVCERPGFRRQAARLGAGQAAPGAGLIRAARAPVIRAAALIGLLSAWVATGGASVPLILTFRHAGRITCYASVTPPGTP